MVDPDEDEDEDMCTLIVALMQCGRRQEGANNLTIGYDIYEVE